MTLVEQIMQAYPELTLDDFGPIKRTIIVQDDLKAQVAAVTVANLPLVATVGQGARHMVTDSNSVVFGNIVAGGGANIVSVYSDGTNWRIG